jgi:hypothetical protein
MKTKTKHIVSFNWKIAFFIMTGMFIALLFYTAVLSLQARMWLHMSYKKMKMQSMANQPGSMMNDQEMKSTTSAMLSTDSKTGNKTYTTDSFQVTVPKNWEMEKYEYPIKDTLEAYRFTNTTSEMTKKNGGGMEPKESIFLRIEDKKKIPLALEDRIRRFTGFDSAATEKITINGKETSIAYGGGQGTLGWYTFIEDATRVAVFQSKNSDSKVKTALYPGVGEQKEIISSFSFK